MWPRHLLLSSLAVELAEEHVARQWLLFSLGCFFRLAFGGLDLRQPRQVTSVARDRARFRGARTSAHDLCCRLLWARLLGRRLDIDEKLDGLCFALGPARHPAAQAQHQVQRRFLLDVVVRERATVLELLARENEALLVGRNALLVLDLALDHVDRVGGLHLESDCLARQRLDENLQSHAHMARAGQREPRWEDQRAGTPTQRYVLRSRAGLCLTARGMHAARTLPAY